MLLWRYRLLGQPRRSFSGKAIFVNVSLVLLTQWIALCDLPV